jgi:hypothetical protein
MNQIDKPSNLEKVSGSLITEIGMTALATYVGTPLAALLPVLSNSLASGRHKKRVEKALFEINKTLIAHEELIKNLTDAQYKIINEAILAILQATEEEKITYLKSAVENNIEEEHVSISHASQISRILRDISAEELKFLIKYGHYSRIIFNQEPMNDRELKVETSSNEGIIVSGLISMGLMVPGAATFDDIGRYQFSPLVKMLLTVIGT